MGYSLWRIAIREVRLLNVETNIEAMHLRLCLELIDSQNIAQA